MEESAGMNLMIAALVKAQGSDAWLTESGYWTVLQTWADNLVSALPDPQNQLT